MHRIQIHDPTRPHRHSHTVVAVRWHRRRDIKYCNHSSTPSTRPSKSSGSTSRGVGGFSGWRRCPRDSQTMACLLGAAARPPGLSPGRRPGLLLGRRVGAAVRRAAPGTTCRRLVLVSTSTGVLSVPGAHEPRPPGRPCGSSRPRHCRRPAVPRKRHRDAAKLSPTPRRVRWPGFLQQLTAVAIVDQSDCSCR